jgi:hypothetical protein
MTFDDALKAAKLLAECNYSRLGDCLFADGEPDSKVWIMGFAVVERPDWFWHIIVTDCTNIASIIAMHHRPPQEPLPSRRRVSGWLNR